MEKKEVGLNSALAFSFRGRWQFSPEYDNNKRPSESSGKVTSFVRDVRMGGKARRESSLNFARSLLPVRTDGSGRTTDGPKKMGKSMKPEMGVLRLSLMLLGSDRRTIPATFAESSGISALKVSKLSRWWKWTLAASPKDISNPSMIMLTSVDSLWIAVVCATPPPEPLGNANPVEEWGDSGPVCAGGAPPPTAEALGDWSLPDDVSMIDNSNCQSLARAESFAADPEWSSADVFFSSSLVFLFYFQIFFPPTKFSLILLNCFSWAHVPLLGTDRWIEWRQPSFFFFAKKNFKTWTRLYRESIDSRFVCAARWMEMIGQIGLGPPKVTKEGASLESTWILNKVWRETEDETRPLTALWMNGPEKLSSAHRSGLDSHRAAPGWRHFDSMTSRHSR